jgi:hypothetical protein
MLYSLRSILPFANMDVSSGYPFWLMGANEPIIEKHFKILKNSEQKFHIHIQTYYVRTQIFQKKEYFFVSRIKKTNLCMKI